MSDVKVLEDKIAKLEQENIKLKTLLDKAGISYESKEKISEKYQENQGARIIPKCEISEDDANHFFAMFWGRTDVYSKRVIAKKTGEPNYYPQCYKFWKYGCPKVKNPKKACSECSNPIFKKLDKEQVLKHLKGEKENGLAVVIGVYPLLPDDTCRFIVFDFDNHKKGSNKSDYANEDESWKEEVDALREICKINEIDALVERSRSGRGAHLWIFFDQKIDATLARRFGMALLRKGAEAVNLKSFKFYDRMLPMQDHMPKGGFGNLIALPLQAEALANGNSAFVDEQWNAYPDQWKILLSKNKLSKDDIENKMLDWKMHGTIDSVNLEEICIDDNTKPWEKIKEFNFSDANGIVEIVLADAIYVKTENIKPRLQNQIRELAAFSNPVFFKNEAIGLSNFDNARYIYLGKDENGYIRIPRGLLDELEEGLNKARIKYQIADERCEGRHINVSFNGVLKPAQISAMETLEKKTTGILDAATAFGKTVVCCNLIARKQVSTLILLQSTTLLEQWKRALDKFLIINEPMPEYETPTGRIKTRKSLIGYLQGPHDSTTGIVDIAMVGSICKKGEYHKRLKEYGLVIVDECHHAASDTIVDVLNEVTAKYVYGVTATPFRGDGLQRINFMMLGPIRYKYSSKDRAKEQGIGHYVYPRFTRAVAPRFNTEKMHPNEAYEIIRHNNDRDELIIADVKECITNGRTPVVLSKYVEHSKKLYERIKEFANKTFLLMGENSKKEHKQILAEMDEVKPEESMALVATGSLVGEGFDYPRLDTLIMATPVAGKSVVEQYAGRLNRDYVGKKNVIVYDYVDAHIPMFDNMYHKRLKAYKQIGYSMYQEKQTGDNNYLGEINSIFDIDTYQSVYRADLLLANNEIIISSPVINSHRIDVLAELLRNEMLAGLKVRIVTWQADAYSFGDSEIWMSLHDKMRRIGFEVNLVQDYCEHFCIIDKRIVWYGSMNFLGKEDINDNLMRIDSEKIAAELLELTFGNEKVDGEWMR